MRRAVVYLIGFAILVLSYSVFADTEIEFEADKLKGDGVLTPYGVPNMRRFGIGFMVGEPTGLTFRIDIQPEHSIEIMPGWSWYNYGDRQFAVFVNYHYKMYGIIPIPSGATALYVGAGMGAGGTQHHSINNDYQVYLGTRLPVGILYQLTPAPLEFFFEVAFVIDWMPEVYPGFNAILGMRFAF